MRLGILIGLAVMGVTTAPGAPARAEEPAPAAAGKLTRPPKLTKFVAAEYPPARKQAGEEAAVVLKLTIAADGTVPEVEVATSAVPDFDAAAIAAARQFVFEPAEIDGAPAAIRILYRYDFVITKEVKTTADLTGVVRDHKTGKPLAGIALTAGGKTAITGADGRFSFADLPAGKLPVGLAGPGITALRTDETLEAGQKTDVVYDVTPETKVDPADADDLEIVVVAPPLQKAVASVTVAADQGRRVPGTSGDVLKVVESMAGVGRSSAGSGALVVWGAAPQDTRVYVDGVRLPSLYHIGGLRSVLAGDLVKSIELVPGGYGAGYGRGLGGIVLVAMAPLEGEGIHGSAAADVIDASLALRATLAPRLRGAFAFRQGYLGSTLDLASDRDVGDIFPIPHYRDGQLRLAYQLSADETIELAGLMSSDEVARVVVSSDPTYTKRDDRDLSFARAWTHYRRAGGDGTTTDLVAYVGTDHAGVVNQYGGPETALTVDSKLYGFRGSWRGRLVPSLTLTVGLDAEAETAKLRRRGAITVPAREGDVRAFGQLPPDQVNFDDWDTLIASLAPYGELDLGLFGDRLHLLPGLRVEPFVTSTSRRTPATGTTPSIGRFAETTTVQPRLTARLAATQRLTFTASAGSYRQAPLAEDLSAVFGNPTLPIARATHYVLGASLRLTDTLVTEVTLFRSTSSGLAARSPLGSPALAEALLPLGSGRTIGGQVMLRREQAGRFFGWVSYSLMKSIRRDPVDLCETAAPPAECAAGPVLRAGPERLFDYDQTHLLTAVGSYDLGRGFELGLRVRYATGFPRTEVVDNQPDLRTGTYQPLFGAHNGIRLPAFFQADARLSKRMRFGRETLELYLDVQNVTSRANAEEFAYSPDFQQRRTITGLPFLPVLGARYAW